MVTLVWVIYGIEGFEPLSFMVVGLEGHLEVELAGWGM
jgi:hypothetical protein